MPPLPKERVSKSRPFQNIGLDYSGPLTIKILDRHKKIWICLFTCFVTRAIHLEIVSDLSTVTFLNCCRKFFARRGVPEKILSDNASQFKLSQKVFDSVWNNLVHDTSINSYFASNNINWSCITHYAPWEGGFYERLVGLVKICLRKSIGRKLLNYDDFSTLVTEVEGILNSRPLTYLSDDLTKINILRPIDFISPTVYLSLPIEENQESNYSHLDSVQKVELYWKKSLQTLDHFWNLWYTEYLSCLRERTQLQHKHKRLEAKCEPVPDEIVLIKEDNNFRGFWKLGRIVELNEGKDGNIRSAEVKLPNNNILKKPINSLYPLEINDTHQTQKQSTVVNTIVMNNHTLPFIFLLIYILLPLSVCENISQIIKIVEITTKSPLPLSNFYNICKDTSKLSLVYSEHCVERGFSLYKVFDQHKYCFIENYCQNQHLYKNGSCHSKCSCPDWANSCNYIEDHFQNPSNLQQILEFGQPNICSLIPDDNCALHEEIIKFPQILLYDNTTHFVKDLTIQYQSLNLNWTCLGEGLVIGSPEFCKINQCYHNGTNFCFMKKNEIDKYFNQDWAIPIKAWGYSQLKFYPSKSLSESISWNLTSFLCELGGVKIFFPKSPDNIIACSLPYCYQIHEPTNNVSVIFPKEILIKDYEFYVDIYDNGQLVNHLTGSCYAHIYCEMIKCYFCLENLQNPHCFSTTYIFLLCFIFYLILSFCYIEFKILKIIFKTSKCMIYIFYSTCKCLTFLKSLINKLTKSKIRNSDSTELLLSNNATYKPSTSKYDHALCVVAVSLCLVLVDGCTEVVSFSAPSSQCHLWKNQSQTCTITETTRLVLMPQGQKACLLIKNKENDLLGTISVEVQRVFLQCKNKNEYFTRSYSMHVISSKRCNWMGSCSDSKCEAVKLDTIVDELKGESSSYPGFSYCSESCGCWACNCFSCEAACLFYRVYAKPTADVFEVFSCPIWELKVVIKVNLYFSDIEKEEIFTVSPGISVEWENLKLTITSVTQPQVPALSSKFLSDGTRIAYVHASNFGDLGAGSIGDLQCSSYSQAIDSFHDCKLSPQICNCNPQELSASCSCSEKNLFSYFTLRDNLPINMQGLSLIGSNNLVEAQYHQFLNLEMQIEMQGLHLITLSHKNKCSMKTIKLTGCYNCLTSAKIDVECNTDFGETLAHVFCPSVTFSIKCSSNKTYRHS